MNGVLSAGSASKHCERILNINSDYTVWAIMERSSGQYIGHRFLTIHLGQLDPELGFLFFRSYWGCGFGAEVARRPIAYACGEIHVPRIIATVDADHHPSIRVPEKAGLKLEATEEDEHGPHYAYALTREMYSGVGHDKRLETERTRSSISTHGEDTATNE